MPKTTNTFLFNEAMQENIERKMLVCWSVLVLKSKSSNYLVLIIHGQLANYLLGAGRIDSQTYFQDI